MNLAHVHLIVTKELRELGRDVRSLVLLIVVPALLYPLLMLGAGHLAVRGQDALLEETVLIRLVTPLSPEVEQTLEQLPGAELVRDVDEMAAARRPDVTVRTAPPHQAHLDNAVLIEVDGASERGLSAGRRVREALEEAREAAVRERVSALLPELPLEYGAVEVIDIAPKERRGAFVLSRLLAPLLLMVLVLGAFHPAVETSVGERERQTLRTLLASPIHPRSIALGKLLVVALVALLAATANLLGFSVTLAAGLAPLGAMGEVSLSLTTMLSLALVLVPLSLYVAALLLAAASFARTTKEAQVYLTPLLLLLTLPAVAAVLPGVEASWPRAMLPVYGPALVVRELLAGSASWSLVAAAVVGALVVVVVTVGIAARAFTTEALLTGRVTLPLRKAGALDPFDAVLLLLAVSAGLVVLGGFSAAIGGVATILLPQLGVFLGLPLVFAAARSTTPAAALGLRRPARGSGMAWLGALLFAPSLAALAERLSRAFFVLDDDTRHMFEGLLAELAHLPAPWLFVLLALLPAVAEELCFRGAILGAFSSRPWLGLVVSSVAFSAMHGALIRALPTVLLGLVAGLVTLRARSVLPAMTLHLWHNGLVLLVAAWIGSAHTGTDVSTASLYDQLPLWTHLVGVIGFVLLLRGLTSGRPAQLTPGRLG